MRLPRAIPPRAASIFSKNNEVDVILSDIGLPDQNGYDFIAQVRRQNLQVTAIAVSAYFTAADQERGHDAGFDMHFRSRLHRGLGDARSTPG